MSELREGWRQIPREREGDRGVGGLERSQDGERGLTYFLVEPEPAVRILETARHRATVDVIELAAARAVRRGPVEFPLLARVVEVEMAVRRHPGRLDGTEVGADDGRLREFVGHFDRPESCPRADVQDTSGGGVGVFFGSGEGRLVQGTVDDHAEDMVG